MTAAGPGEVGRARPIRPVEPASARPVPKTQPAGKGAASFGQVLQEVLAEGEQVLRFSAHARRRLEERRIPLTDELQRRLADAVERARAKGAREAVVMVDRVAFVVSVKNRTVITVADGSQLRESVFTNIDSVVFA